MTMRWSALPAILFVAALSLAATAVSPPSRDPTDEDYRQHIAALRKKLPHDGFTVVLQKPFVVVGDEPAATVRRRAVGTVKWATDHLKRSYFDKDPGPILDIWLFRDEESYEKHAEQLFGSKPSTPFGYYSSAQGALVMNIATGGGTLVHEIVHPFVEANFPACPAWFNEGLGSLYEQSQEREGQIWGLTNWRLKGLQQAIRDGSLPTFEELCGTSSGEFYGRDRGQNYAQARYLLYYLQHRKLLRRYYRQFVENHEKDPTGFETLRKILGEDDMKAFQKQWGEFVLGLSFS